MAQPELVCNDCENSPVTATDTTITPQSALPTSANQLQLVNIGLSGVIVPCSKVGDIVPGPQFMLPLPQSDYDVKLDVVNSSSASAAGTTLYLSYNPATGFLRVGPNGPAIDVTQVYSAILINRKTLEQSDPFIFTAIIHTCVMHITGPKSFSVCIGIGTPYLGGYTGLNYTAENVGLLANGVNWNTVNPQTGVAIAPLPCPGGSAGPFVTACTGNCDLNQCYLIDRQTGNPEFFAKGNRTTSACGTCFPIPPTVTVAPCTAFETFTQTITVIGNAPGYINGILADITVTYDSTCNSLAVFNVTY
ncbi:hypothetical protein BV898_14127 [Hypsibius exemplaris]|uniref:Uncharacterized protein n=1 Tax=Hypsibius exemplaris TaxID=2072580 RepID=A0A1W0W8M0_HYPEX|nr:hypothetical protein BV898_14127 [Hypsibius exemplaris]